MAPPKPSQLRLEIDKCRLSYHFDDLVVLVDRLQKTPQRTEDDNCFCSVALAEAAIEKARSAQATDERHGHAQEALGLLKACSSFAETPLLQGIAHYIRKELSEARGVLESANIVEMSAGSAAEWTQRTSSMHIAYVQLEALYVYASIVKGDTADSAGGSDSDGGSAAKAADLFAAGLERALTRFASSLDAERHAGLVAANALQLARLMCDANESYEAKKMLRGVLEHRELADAAHRQVRRCLENLLMHAPVDEEYPTASIDYASHRTRPAGCYVPSTRVEEAALLLLLDEASLSQPASTSAPSSSTPTSALPPATATTTNTTSSATLSFGADSGATAAAAAAAVAATAASPEFTLKASAPLSTMTAAMPDKHIPSLLGPYEPSASRGVFYSPTSRAAVTASVPNMPMTSTVAAAPVVLDVVSLRQVETNRVYDRLTMILASEHDFLALSETLDRSMQHSFEDTHMWVQFAYALAAHGEHARAVAVLQQCARDPHSAIDSPSLLVAVKIALVHLADPARALTLAHAAAAAPGADFVRARLAHLTGLAKRALSHTLTVSLAEREKYAREALEDLQSAYERDKQCTSIALAYATQLSEMRRIADAEIVCAALLEREPTHAAALHLLTLLLSAKKQHKRALKACEAALEVEPAHLGLQHVHALLLAELYGPQAALPVLASSLSTWQVLYKGARTTEQARKGHTPSQLLIRVLGATWAGADTGTLEDALQQYAHEIESATGTQTSSVGGGGGAVGSGAAAPTTDGTTGTLACRCAPVAHVDGHATGLVPARPFFVSANHEHARIWLALAKVFTDLGQLSDAHECVREAALLNVNCAEAYVQQALVFEADGDPLSALAEYDKALALDPLHAESMVRAGAVLLADDEVTRMEIASRHLREAAQLDSQSPETWYYLGLVLQRQGELDAAADSFARALAIEATTPIVPFTSLPLPL